MNREFGDGFYTSVFVQDLQQGFSGLELRRHRKGTDECIAKVIFWDACGQFFVEMSGTEVPLEILEELIAEAKKTIKIA